MESVNLSLNGVSGTLWEIRRQEHIHYYLGYRQAVLIANSLLKNLRLARLNKKATQCMLKEQNDKLILLGDGDDKEILLLEIGITEDSLDEQSSLIRDTELELKVAMEEKERIAKKYPELLGSYENVQNGCSQIALLAKLARSMAIATYSSLQGVSEGVAETIFDSGCLSLDDQQVLHSFWSEKMTKLIPANPDNTFNSENTLPS